MRRSLLPFRKNETLMPSDLFKGFFGSSFIDDLFDSSLLATATANIRTDIKETDKEYIVEAELPGFKKENINVEWQEGVLTISAKQDKEIKEEKDNYIRRERAYGEVARSFRIDGIKEDKITGEYKNGILKIVLPKTEEGKVTGKKIEIK
ncbi:MAG: Hsp20/alpha crystallin family protein [Syntrophomonadaceae bacterium]|nr:Hsp20/alpha crystallin family protein [Syntrophomonadaceae bacterium]